MAKIHILDEHIANQIAAGEVVERPASVVKELVENAIDAGSTKIEVTIEEGGLQSIRVTDNGSGIEPEDCESAFYRHATSKITNGRDLFHITSLGFRGEALPSIASVSKIALTTSSQEDGLGRKLTIEGGNLLSNDDSAAPRGTDFVVKELFYNTPARLKYMKTIQTELGHISDYMYRIALSHPGIAITLRHNDNTLLQTVGNGDLLQVIAAIYGTQAAKAMLPIQAEDMDYSLQGYVSIPEWTRSNRNAISTFVNGRYIRNNGLNHAILRAYHTLLPINRYPLAILSLTMHPSIVDVNVHPAKLEVRFSKENELYPFVEQAIHAVLRQQVLIPQPVKHPIGNPGSTSFIQEQFRFNKDQQTANLATAESRNQSEKSLSDSSIFVQSDMMENASSRPMIPPNYVMNDDRSVVNSPVRERSDQNYRINGAMGNRPEQGKNVPFNPEVYATPRNGSPEIPPFPELTLIGQHHGTYLIAQNEEGLYLIDQHAAHERINYEFYYEQFGRPGDASQELLLPITLEFTPSETEQLKQKINWFEQVGVYLEHFGGQTFRVRAHPYWFPKGDEQALIEEMAEWVLSERMIDLAKLREKSSILCSCKASIKANQKLTNLESDTLLERLAACKQPYTCPHGRPIVISFSSYDLEKLFKRVM
ncbi:DNA mismatch repair endonuclease MutL [Paenibacillus macquariensis]|uniref:DNA mismatch repair protein MutL n=1 Tax=Paenibacillus macquariensis TaxID=948756 RepID=A0ABY1JVD4_9BACL|nr:DNA mismatch repair endonuclease MutL [Paenibacillus macquariensis]MEC0090946.1 DNA mismatch repair endonuclease MutL [Paenibacillus macquariensis]OAB34672.1 DNA mismatch repair protein MutL [Paenibacillus macquariensis subsp. macquariensis]SIQ80126.1 DNA mismatch repair protein MutL [Paenibacillus macquariensis]